MGEVQLTGTASSEKAARAAQPSSSSAQAINQEAPKRQPIIFPDSLKGGTKRTPASANPNFVSRKAWPDNKYVVKYPASYDPTVHRFKRQKTEGAAAAVQTNGRDASLQQNVAQKSLRAATPGRQPSDSVLSASFSALPSALRGRLGLPAKGASGEAQVDSGSHLRAMPATPQPAPTQPAAASIALTSGAGPSLGLSRSLQSRLRVLGTQQGPAAASVGPALVAPQRAVKEEARHSILQASATSALHGRLGGPTGPAERAGLAGGASRAPHFGRALAALAGAASKGVDMPEQDRIVEVVPSALRDRLGPHADVHGTSSGMTGSQCGGTLSERVVVVDEPKPRLNGPSHASKVRLGAGKQNRATASASGNRAGSLTLEEKLSLSLDAVAAKSKGRVTVGYG